MDPRASIPLVPLHLTSLAILSPTNAPLYIRSFTSGGENDELRHYHLSHAAVDVIEERIVMTSTPTKPADSYLGLLFCMEDMAFYGFQTTTKLRMVLSVALVDAMIKDADIVAIFRAVHHLVLTATHNPFLSIPEGFKARPAPSPTETSASNADDVDSHGKAKAKATEEITNPLLPISKAFAAGPEDIRGEWLRDSRRFQSGISKIGETLCGARA